MLFHKDSTNLEKYSTRFGQPEYRVINYALRSFSAAERKYSQIEKETLFIIFGVKKYEKYPMGRHFTIYTDHKLQVKLFDFQQTTSATVATRLQR